jgi:exodeoxyribonuclease VII large subunit
MAGLPQRLRHNVGRLIDTGQDEAARAVQRARHRWDVLLQLAQADVDQLLARVISLSPQAVLNRGYAVLSDPTGMVIRRADQAGAGSQLLARVADGRFAVRVTEAL